MFSKNALDTLPSQCRPQDLLPDTPHLRRLRRELHAISAVVHYLLERAPVEDLPGSPLTVDQMRLLRFIALNPGLRVTEVAKGLGIKASSASLGLDRLQTKEFINREGDGDDRRVIRLRVTEKGRALVDLVERTIETKLRAAATRLGAPTTKRVAELLVALVQALMHDEDYFGDLCLHCGPGYSESCVTHQMFGKCRYDSGDGA